MRNHSEFNVDIKVGHVVANKTKKLNSDGPSQQQKREKANLQRYLYMNRWKLLSEFDNIDKGEDDRPSQKLPKQDDGL